MRAAPVRVAGFEGVARVVADGDRTCAVGADRRVYCWGAGEGHALGNGEARDQHTPTPVRGSEDFGAVGGGVRPPRGT